MERWQSAPLNGTEQSSGVHAAFSEFFYIMFNLIKGGRVVECSPDLSGKTVVFLPEKKETKSLKYWKGGRVVECSPDLSGKTVVFLPGKKETKSLKYWKGGRVVECGGLENRCPEFPDRGFESPPFRILYLKSKMLFLK